MESRTANMIIHKSGGTSTGETCKITIPTVWAKELGFTKENRACTITKKGKKIIIEKAE